MKRFARRTLVVAVLCVFAMFGAGGQAFAGEITGNGKLLTVNGASICAYSGQNDEYHNLGPGHPRVQSFGQEVRVDGAMGGIPGMACNPSR